VVSRTAEYAIRAVLALAGLASGEARTAAELAEELGVPKNYLSKTLNRLARCGLLTSVRGPRGGFRLARPASEIPMAEIVAEFDDSSPSGRCVMGGRQCDGRDPCVAHEQWKQWSESMARLMGDTTVAEFAAGRGGPVAGADGVVVAAQEQSA
jgi:Rrf2 family iron-sulfur cluster assembly transcriptional regulator